jgi:hypothetical protein
VVAQDAFALVLDVFEIEHDTVLVHGVVNVTHGLAAEETDGAVFGLLGAIEAFLFVINSL